LRTKTATRGDTGEETGKFYVRGVSIDKKSGVQKGWIKEKKQENRCDQASPTPRKSCHRKSPAGQGHDWKNKLGALRNKKKTPFARREVYMTTYALSGVSSKQSRTLTKPGDGREGGAGKHQTPT